MNGAMGFSAGPATGVISAIGFTGEIKSPGAIGFIELKGETGFAGALGVHVLFRTIRKKYDWLLNNLSGTTTLTMPSAGAVKQYCFAIRVEFPKLDVGTIE
mmetsp:Transcript_27997/g.40076  ORF Transcript_27997/g.40076 Transcript_27997/m.40076 type:complete len:101 (-) Transcript_27997:141-443(-)